MTTWIQKIEITIFHVKLLNSKVHNSTLNTHISRTKRATYWIFSLTYRASYFLQILIDARFCGAHFHGVFLGLTKNKPLSNMEIYPLNEGGGVFRSRIKVKMSLTETLWHSDLLSFWWPTRLPSFMKFGLTVSDSWSFEKFNQFIRWAEYFRITYCICQDFSFLLLLLLLLLLFFFFISTLILFARFLNNPLTLLPETLTNDRYYPNLDPWNFWVTWHGYDVI